MWGGVAGRGGEGEQKRIKSKRWRRDISMQQTEKKERKNVVLAGTEHQRCVKGTAFHEITLRRLQMIILTATGR